MDTLVPFTDSGMLSAFVSKVMNEVDNKVAQRETDKGWFTSLVELIEFSVAVQDSFGILQSYALAVIKDHWEDVDIGFRTRYSNNFYEFAYKVTGGRWKASTTDKNMSTARAFMGFEPFGSIAVPVRDESGNKVIENGKVKKDYIEWDITKPSFSKLAVVAPLARSGALAKNAELLGMLMDDGVTVEQLQLAVYEPNEEYNPQFRFSFVGSKIIAHYNGWENEIAEIDWEMFADDETARDAIRDMLRRVGIKLTPGQQADLTG